MHPLRPVSHRPLSRVIGWMERVRERTTFFVQEFPKEPWHVESDADPEIMLCGFYISVDSMTAKVQYRRGPRWCPDCWVLLLGLRSRGER